MTHLTSTRPTGGRAGPARAWPPFLCRGGPGSLRDPALPPGCPSGVPGRGPRPRAASPGPSPHCSSARRGPGPRSGSPPRPGTAPTAPLVPCAPWGGRPRRLVAPGPARGDAPAARASPSGRGRGAALPAAAASLVGGRAHVRRGGTGRAVAGRASGPCSSARSRDWGGSAAPEPERQRPQPAGRDREEGPRQRGRGRAGWGGSRAGPQRAGRGRGGTKGEPSVRVQNPEAGL